MAQLITVKLSRFDGSPWGFRLQGGKDFGTPLVVQKVNGGSPAEQAGLKTGDAVIRVNTADVFNLRHKDAQDIIVRSGNSFELTVQRGGSTWRPTTSPVTPSIPSPQPSAPAACISPITKTSLVAKKQDESLIGSGHNLTPKPFINGRNEGSIKSIVNKQYNSPVGMYSEETIAETLSAQAEVLAGGVLGVNFKKNERDYNAQNSEVFKMVQEADKEPRSPEPAEPALNSNVPMRSSPAIAGLRSVSAPEPKPQPTTPQSSLPPGQNICADCERLIVGVFVRIKEKNLHVECFKCSTCGTSLKNVGYYNINNKLYCDIHAKLIARQQAPTSITTQPIDKAPENTILAALAHRDCGAPMSPPLRSQGSPQPFSSHAAHDISGPKPFGSPSAAVTSSFSVPHVTNSGINPRPLSQTVTERYYESDRYEVIDLPIAQEQMTARYDHQQQDQRPPSSCSSVRNKSLVWPPVKPIEDITYPTASPIWIDPNPVLEKRRRNNPCVKRVIVQQGVDCYCGSRSCSYCCSGYEERDYERYSSLSQVSNREGSMDRASCTQPFYRKIEIADTRRNNCRVSTYTPRPGSTDGLRRSLTPTRISQPVPRPWMATVTSGTSAYRHVQPPVQPEPEIVCQQICRCQIICEKTAQGHTYREVCCDMCRPPVLPQPKCTKYSETVKIVPQKVNNKPSENEVIDLSKVVPPDVAVCPKGVENQHNMFTETMEKDVGDIHIKKTTIYENTVEVLSPERARSPEPQAPVVESSETRQMSLEEETVQRSSVTLDREVERISDRGTVIESTEVLNSAISTAQLMEDARKEEEERRSNYEKICREEEERLRRQEQECMEQQRRYEEERARRTQKKRVAFNREDRSETTQQQQQQLQECQRPKECYRCETYTEKASEAESSGERYDEVVQDIKIQENFEQTDNDRHRSLREQVEIHQCIREQQVAEKRPSLQERRLSSRFRDSSADRSEQTAKSQQPQQSESYPKKHVQFVAPTTSSTVTRLPPSNIKNATAKEWKSDMLNALTTAPTRPYSPLDGFSCQPEKQAEPVARTIYTTEIRYEDTCRPCPKQVPQPMSQERPVSPFQSALITAPERPYTPLGCEFGGGYDNVICVDRSQTPIDLVTGDGYCHPAEILYTDDKTREAQSRERNLKKVEGPQPLPIPPQNHRLRDCSASPANSLSRPGTPRDRTIMAGLKKPGTIPSYQRYLVSMQHDPEEAQPYVPSRTPTPNRPISPGQRQSEPTGCFMRAQAPRIRECSTPVNQVSMSSSQQAPTTSEHREYVSYHVESDTPACHRSQDYRETQTSYLAADYRNDNVTNKCQQVEDYRRSESKSSVTVQSQDVNKSAPSCGISKGTRVQPSLACPLSHCSNSERFPKTGVRVLPPCPVSMTVSQSYDSSRRYCQEQVSSCAKSYGSSRPGSCTADSGNCSATTKMPYPQIPSSCESDNQTTSCDGCVYKSQSICQQQDSSSCSQNVQSFQPIREQPRTNLSNQLTRLTVRRDKQPASKPVTQSQTFSQCSITDNNDSHVKTQYRQYHMSETNVDNRKPTNPTYLSSQQNLGSGIGGPNAGGRSGKLAGSSAPTRGRGILNQASGPGSRQPLCGHCNSYVRGPFITALGQIWCPEHFVCVNTSCRRALQDIGFVEEKGQLHCEYCFERFIAPACSKCNSKIKGDCLNAVGKHFHPDCFNCSYCGKLFGNNPFFLEEGLPYCESDWNELFTTKCYACGFPVEAGDRWVEALNNNYHSQCFNCTMCKKNLEGQSFYAKGGRPFCKNHAR